MYQQITLVGNVGKDAELRYTSAGVAVASFSMAVSKTIGSGEERREITTWFKVTAWRQLAEIVGEYVKKGGKVLIVGEIAASAYIDKSGKAQATLDVTADTLKLLGGGTREPAPAPGEPPPVDTNDIPF